jgi:hypothetical protein
MTRPLLLVGLALAVLLAVAPGQSQTTTATFRDLLCSHLNGHNVGWFAYAPLTKHAFVPVSNKAITSISGTFDCYVPATGLP